MNELYINKNNLTNKATLEVFDKLFSNQDLISVEDIICALEDEYWHNEELQEELDNLQSDLENNYKYIGDYECYGVSEHDFH